MNYTNDIIFTMSVKRGEDFAKAGNFIDKVEKHIELSKEESRGILFRRARTDEKIGDRMWLEDIRTEHITVDSETNEHVQEELGTIKSPELIKNLNDNFRINFVLLIDEKSLPEIVQYQELILLLAGYSKVKIYGYIAGNRAFYYKLSQYLYLAVQDMELGNYVYYRYEDKGKIQPQRMQSNNMRQSGGFLPLMIVNEKNRVRLKEKCVEQLGNSTIKNVIYDEKITYSTIKSKIEWRELGGIVMLLLQNREVIQKLDSVRVEKIFSNLDVLALALLVYSMKEFAGDITLQELSSYANLQQQYANACHQLMENIVFHSDAGWGTISIRIHKNDVDDKSSYLGTAYGLARLKNSLFEVKIRDFTGNKTGKNIAEHFCGNLASEYRQEFKSLKPRDLFASILGTGSKFARAWQKYYTAEQHMGKHMGLRIFQKIVKDCNGYFRAESHNGYRKQEEDDYIYQLDNIKSTYVMPGTAYEILLPLKREQDIYGAKRVSHEYSDWIVQNASELIELEAQIFSLDTEFHENSNQREKEQQILQIAEKIIEFVKACKKSIVAIKVQTRDKNYAEMYGKGIIQAAYAIKSIPHIVVYNCTDEFAREFKNILEQIYVTGMYHYFVDDMTQVAVMTQNNDQTAYLLGNAWMTDALNQYISRTQGIRYNPLRVDHMIEIDWSKVISQYIPYDVLIKEQDDTLFEKYTLKVLEENIQQDEFGCKIETTHMRLGSTVHIDTFYEGEILFGNKYFVSRFAFLMLKDLYKDIAKKQKITIYGYASYSETLVVTLRNALRKVNDKLELDYILLEREEEHRDAAHTDHIRYEEKFWEEKADEQVKKERKNYMRDRDYIIVVPINSTLKTHQRLISKLQEENGKISDKRILRNYALILIGPEKSSVYWKRRKGKELQCVYKVKPNPKYFISVSADYQEPLECKMCFPSDSLHERPLIEVNAASTIPNQAFGIVQSELGREIEDSVIEEKIKGERDKLQVLKSCVLYCHIIRNETHFLYYIQTEKLVTKESDKIKESLEQWMQGNEIPIRENEYNIIVAPMHYSNCKFVEIVNDVVFQGMASVIRIDFNKDFRSNVQAKFSYIRQYIRQLNDMEEKRILNFQFVDDNIVTGRTFYRAKSLMESIVSIDNHQYENVEITIFDRVFTLIDRNSPMTRMQYINSGTRAELDVFFYSFLRLEISSLRNYGDSCVLCNLQKEAERLHETASTAIVADYWKTGNEKFGLITVEDADEKQRQKDADAKQGKRGKGGYAERAYRRLLCSHIIKKILDDLGGDNQTVHVAKILLKIMTISYQNNEDKDEAFEYVVSYLKVCSRPFLVFQKSVKEAIYDILLILIEYITKGYEEKNCITIDRMIQRGGRDKAYWLDLAEDWHKFEEVFLTGRTYEQQRDLVLMIIKQLTELKSNYILRKENMYRIFAFMRQNIEKDTSIAKTKRKEQFEDFWKRYVIHVKKLTGISSDTSKSMWLDNMLMDEMNDKWWMGEGGIDATFAKIIRLENTMNFQSGLENLYKKLQADVGFWEKAEQYTECFCNKDSYNRIVKKHLEKWNEEYNIVKNNEIWEKSFLNQISNKAVFHPVSARNALGVERSKIMNRAVGEMNGCVADPLDDLVADKYQESIQGYQFENFIILMKKIGWYVGKSCTSIGIRNITCCLMLKRICEDAKIGENELLGRIDKMAKLTGAIMGEIPVQIYAEYADSSEFYKEAIREAFYQKENELEIAGGKSFHKKIEEFRAEKRYHRIGDNTGYIPALDEVLEKRLNDQKILAQLDEYGFVYHEDGYFLWKLGRKSKYPLYLQAVFPRKDIGKAIYDIRNVLALANEIEKSLFDAGMQNYLREIDMTKSQLDVLKREKSTVHTKETKRIGKQQEQARGASAKQHDALVLLSDLQVSKLYRNSLEKDFYAPENTLNEWRWNNIPAILKGNIEIEEDMHSTVKENIKVQIYNRSIFGDGRAINDDDCLVTINGREEQMTALLLATILNVKEEGRGRCGANGIMEVYLEVTDEQMLRISNETECKEDIDDMTKCLEREPLNEESGITVWTLNCYIKRIKVAFIRKRINRVKSKEELLEAVSYAKKLMSEEFCVRMNLKYDDNKRKHFCYELPILWAKYEKQREREA